MSSFLKARTDRKHFESISSNKRKFETIDSSRNSRMHSIEASGKKEFKKTPITSDIRKKFLDVLKQKNEKPFSGFIKASKVDQLKPKNKTIPSKAETRHSSIIVTCQHELNYLRLKSGKFKLKLSPEKKPKSVYSLTHMLHEKTVDDIDKKSLKGKLLKLISQSIILEQDLFETIVRLIKINKEK